MIAEAATSAALRLTISPERIRLRPREKVSLVVRAPGPDAARVTLDVAPYALDARGRPLIGGGAPPWVRVSPRTLTVPARGTARVTVVAAVPSPASAGDHPFVVLASVRDARAVMSPVLVRLGVVAVVRVPGVVHHRLVPGAPLVAPGRLLRLVVANRGNVEEWLRRGAVTLTLRREGRVIAVLRSPARRVLASATTLFEWPLPARLRGPVVARVAFGPGRAYRLRV